MSVPKPTTPRETNRRAYQHYPERNKARVYARRALLRGQIAPPPALCPRCGQTPPPRADKRRGMEMHHPNGWDNYLDFQWLCWKCHSLEKIGTRQPSSYPRAVVLKTQCINGHEFTEANTYWAGSKAKPWHRKKRSCRACARDRERVKAAARRLAGGAHG